MRFLELRANAGQSLRAPSFGELYLEQGTLRPNPDLRPERGGSVDGGVVLRFERVYVAATAFYTLTKDLISYQTFNGVSTPENFAEAEVGGGELEAVARPWRPVTVTASWSRARTSNLRDDPRFYGKELPYSPRDHVKARVAGRRGAYEGFVEGRYQSEQFTDRSNTGDNALPEQLAFRAGAGVRLARRPWEVWLSGQVDNITDAYLVDQVGFPQPGRAFFAVLRATTPDSEGASGDAAEPPVTQDER
jgi:iron complex outermembrane receptor protein